MPIFDEATLRKLEQLTLVADEVRVGMMKGDRRSRKRGSSIEFADYRDYTRGDDLRRLDWNAYARLERPFIKLLEEEEDLAVHLLVDGSGSMDWPAGDGLSNAPSAAHKLGYALRLAAALGHVALSTGDVVTAVVLNSKSDAAWGPFRGRQHSLHLFRFLESARAGGVTDLNLSLRNYALRARRPGLLFLLSDLLSPAGYRDGLSALQSRGYEIGLLHLLSPDEAEPPLNGDLKLIDVETGEAAEITLDAGMREQYRARLQAWQAEITAYCHGRGIHYVPVTTDVPWDKLVLQTMREQGMVQ